METERVPNLDAIRTGDAPVDCLLPQIRLWSSTQLATYLGVSRFTVVRRVEGGRHPATKFDGRHFFTTEQIALAVRYHRMNEQESTARQGRKLGEPLRFEELGLEEATNE